jgi:chromosomal replication initiation ATPase DnaA
MEDLRTTPGRVTDLTIEKICEAHGQVVREVLSDKRSRRLVRARCEVARFLRSKGWSYPVVGKKMGRDHSTIMYNVHRFVDSDQCGPHIDPDTKQPFLDERHMQNVYPQNF